MAYLLDTCAVCESTSPHPNQQVVDRIDSLARPECFLSCITIGEICKGIALLPAGKKRASIESWLHSMILPSFTSRITEIDIGLTMCWGVLLADVEKRGKKMPLSDSLIAATALFYNLTLVTRNTRDFANCGVNIYNPWA